MEAECIARSRTSVSSSRLCVVLMASISLVTLVRNQELVNVMPNWASSASSLVFGIEFAGLAIVGYFAVHIIKPRVFSAIALACTVVGTALWQMVINGGGSSTALFLCASAFFDCGRCWGIVMTALCLSRLDVSKRIIGHTFAGVGLSYVLFAILGPVASAFPLCVASACVAVPICLGYLDNRPLFDHMRSTATPRDLDVANPFSFVPLSGTIYVCIFLFETAFGYAAFLRMTSGPQGSLLIGGALLIVAILCTIGFLKTCMKEDRIFSFCTLVIVSGLLLASVSGLPSAIPSFLLSVGSQCFYCLVWAVLAIVGSRNPTGAFTAICLGFSASSIGADAGFLVGVASHEASLHGFSEAQELIVEALVFCLVAYVLICMKDFRFDGFFESISSVSGSDCRGDGLSSDGRRTLSVVDVAPEEESGEDASAALGGAVNRVCGDGDLAAFDEFALGNGLTPREKEIALLLAKGRNGQFIQEKLVISRNTAKTHIRHIYQKLDVHSQQELIDLFESL